MSELNKLLPNIKNQEKANTLSRKIFTNVVSFSRNIRSMILAFFWFIFVFAILTAAYVAVRLIIFTAKYILQAAGL